jgi:hypothetical protein
MTAGWRDQHQRARVCQVLCDMAGLPGVWRSSGPSSAAISMLDQDGQGLEAGPRCLVLAAWAIWNGSGRMRFAELLPALSENELQSVGGLLLEIPNGPEAIDAWISEEGFCCVVDCPNAPAGDGQLRCHTHTAAAAVDAAAPPKAVH